MADAIPARPRRAARARSGGARPGAGGARRDHQPGHRHHPDGGDAQRERGPERLGHDLPLRVRHDDRRTGSGPTTPRRARATPPQPFAADVTGSDREHDLPLPDRGHERTAGRSTGATARSRPRGTPSRAGASLASATAIGSRGGTVRGNVDPNRAETTYRFEYGTTTSYGRLTPRAERGRRRRPQAGHAPCSAACARTRATTTGWPRPTPPARTRTGDRSFVTQRQPTAITLACRAPRSAGARGWRSAATSTASASTASRCSSSARTSRSLGGFSSENTPAPVRADRFGRFAFFIPAVFTTTRLHARTAHADQRDQRSRRPAGRRAGRRRRCGGSASGATRIRGAITPAVPNAARRAAAPHGRRRLGVRARPRRHGADEQPLPLHVPREPQAPPRASTA